MCMSGFELTYCDSGNMIRFSFSALQFFPTSLKILIPKHNIRKGNFFSLKEKQKLLCC